MTDGTLPLNQNDIGTFVLKGLNHGIFYFTDHKLGCHGIDRYAIHRSLHQAALAGGDHYGFYANTIQMDCRYGMPLS